MKKALTEIRQRLFELKDEQYAEFSHRLIPTINPDTIIGVRAPNLHRLAGELAGSPAEDDFLSSLPHSYHEENALHGLLICKAKDTDRLMRLLEEFLPFVDNWAVCDCLSPRIFKKRIKEFLPAIRQWLKSEHAYTVRFAISMLMKFCLDEDFSPEQLKLVAALRSDEYYVNMMAAWYFATALAKQYEAALPFIEQNALSAAVHGMTIQKAVESRRIADDRKSLLRRLKRPAKTSP